jgi:hypothetical protein
VILRRDFSGDELNCSNPSQTADNHFSGKDGNVGCCSVLKKEAKKLTEHQIAEHHADDGVRSLGNTPL